MEYASFGWIGTSSANVIGKSNNSAKTIRKIFLERFKDKENGFDRGKYEIGNGRGIDTVKYYENHYYMLQYNDIKEEVQWNPNAAIEKCGDDFYLILVWWNTNGASKIWSLSKAHIKKLENLKKDGHGDILIRLNEKKELVYEGNELSVFKELSVPIDNNKNVWDKERKKQVTQEELLYGIHDLIIKNDLK